MTICLDEICHRLLDRIIELKKVDEKFESIREKYNIDLDEGSPQFTIVSNRRNELEFLKQIHTEISKIEKTNDLDLLTDGRIRAKYSDFIYFYENYDFNNLQKYSKELYCSPFEDKVKIILKFVIKLNDKDHEFVDSAEFTRQEFIDIDPAIVFQGFVIRCDKMAEIMIESKINGLEND